MNKFFIILILAIYSGSSQSASLKQEALVDNDHIKMGDIFDEITAEQSQKQIGKAPNPGESIILNSKYLSHITKQNKVEWLPQSDNQSIKVIRESETISPEAILEFVHKEIKGQIHDEHYRTTLHQTPEIYFSKGKMGELKLTEVKLSFNKAQFWATLNKIENGITTKKYKISGEVFPTTKIPVVIKEIKNGEIVRTEDIDLIEVETRKLSGSVITDEKELVGTTPRRTPIRAFTPIKQNEVAPLDLVSKGQAVLVKMTTPVMSLTIKGKALENGAIKQAIKILNTDSNKIIYATVSAPGVVNIETPAMNEVIG